MTENLRPRTEASIKPHRFFSVGGSNPWACQRCPWFRDDPRAGHIEAEASLAAPAGLWLDAILLRYVNLPFGQAEGTECRDAILAALEAAPRSPEPTVVTTVWSEEEANALRRLASPEERKS